MYTCHSLSLRRIKTDREWEVGHLTPLASAGPCYLLPNTSLGLAALAWHRSEPLSHLPSTVSTSPRNLPHCPHNSNTATQHHTIPTLPLGRHRRCSTYPPLNNTLKALPVSAFTRPLRVQSCPAIGLRQASHLKRTASCASLRQQPVRETFACPSPTYWCENFFPPTLPLQKHPHPQRPPHLPTKPPETSHIHAYLPFQATPKSRANLQFHFTTAPDHFLTPTCADCHFRHSHVRDPISNQTEPANKCAITMDTMQPFTTHPTTAQQAKDFIAPSSVSFSGNSGHLTPPSSEKDGRSQQQSQQQQQANGRNGAAHGQGQAQQGGNATQQQQGNGVTPATPAATPGAGQGNSGIIPTLQ